jgi:diguanylate cyclase (GGDEF)-like protein
MSKREKKINIRVKILEMAAVSLLGMILSLFIFYQGLETSLMQEKKIQSQRLSEVGIGIIKYYYSLISEGKLDEADAKQMAAETLEAARFGTDGYYWINDSDGILLMNPYSKDLIGVSFLNQQDIDGNYFFKDFIAVAKSGGGWVEYYWYKPGNIRTENFQKISYVYYFEPWDFILGTGLYIDDMRRDIKLYAVKALIITFGVIVFLIVISLAMVKKFMEKLEHQAIHDPLTSLYSRRLLVDTMNAMVLRHNREKNVLSVIFFDIDHFKKINDEYGHVYGDEVLSKVGKLLKDTCRANDFCFRYGGEEFLVIAFSDEDKAAEILAERIRVKIEEIRFKHKESQFSVTISGGIANRDFSEPLEATIERADGNLYKAKESGRNCIIS